MIGPITGTACGLAILGFPIAGFATVLNMPGRGRSLEGLIFVWAVLYLGLLAGIAGVWVIALSQPSTP